MFKDKTKKVETKWAKSKVVFNRVIESTKTLILSLLITAGALIANTIERLDDRDREIPNFHMDNSSHGDHKTDHSGKHKQEDATSGELPDNLVGPWGEFLTSLELYCLVTESGIEVELEGEIITEAEAKKRLTEAKQNYDSIEDKPQSAPKFDISQEIDCSNNS